MADGSVEVGVASVNEDDLAGGVAGDGGGKEDDHGCHFFRGGHAVAQWDHLLDGFSGAFRIIQRVEPSLVLRGDAFRGKDGVDPYLVRRKGDGPFAGESVHRALGGGVA